ncbi:NAD(P)-dependent oxidoreductase [Danxiaibacter flavus]|uniref:NAD(P)-dependent oxidoreductase n=1 Tax=Danxiaibacter flavus TaxID=3049108 RepID=A0ABV3ZJB3_9BACT|nr:NAD(P)-dependent oxidoreductase [Chitinophagaceae bacterium DXS]
MVAFLGMGLLGSNFVRAMIKKGAQVNVWNRTASKAKALEQYGAKAFENIADAVKDAGVIHVTLKDDDTVNEVLEMIKPALKTGATIIDHTTTSANGAIERTKYWKELGFTYLHAPVFMGPQNALESTGYMLVSGDQEVIRKWQQELAKMTGKVINFGEEEGRAAAMKLIGNSFLVAFTAGIVDALALGKAQNVPVSDIATLFDSWNPAAMLPARLQRVSGGKYDNPSWELSMARKDTQLFMNAADAAGVNLVVIPSIAKQMDKWIEKGFGNSDWTIIGKDVAG